jgi:hypothetical protein
MSFHNVDKRVKDDAILGSGPTIWESPRSPNRWAFKDHGKSQGQGYHQPRHT